MKRKRKHIKLKRKLQKVLGRPSAGNTYYTTMYGINWWYETYNYSLFDNRLPKFDDIKIKRIHGAIGQVVNYDYETKETKYHLEMLPKYSTKRVFLETLVHEMIHLYQMKVREDTGNHNKLFYSFRPKLQFLGLELSR